MTTSFFRTLTKPVPVCLLFSALPQLVLPISHHALIILMIPFLASNVIAQLA
jgi:hypothetical protein